MINNERQFREFLDDMVFDDQPNAAHRDQLEQLLRRKVSTGQLASPSPIKRLFTLKQIKFAAAAVIFLAVALTILILTLKTNPDYSRTIAAANKKTAQREKQLEELRQKQMDEKLHALADDQDQKQWLLTQFEKILQMSKDGNIPGLIDSLSVQDAFLQSLIANSLAEIGDQTALLAMENIIAEQSLTDPYNPIVISAEKLKQRLADQQLADSQSDSEQGDAGAVLTDLALSGRITDTAGQPLSGIEISIHLPNRFADKPKTARTDKNGTYKFAAVNQPDEYQIQIASTEYVGIYQWDQPVKITLAPDSHQTKDFSLAPACMIELDLLTPDEKPLAAAAVNAALLTADRNFISGPVAITDKKGHAVLGGFAPSAEKYIIIAQHADFAPARTIFTPMDPEVIEYEQIKMLPGRTVKGYAEYNDGLPASDIMIAAHPQWWHLPPDRKNFNRTDSNGEFSLNNIAPDTYNISAFLRPDRQSGLSPEFYAFLQTDLPLPEDEILTVTIPQNSPDTFVLISGTITFTSQTKPRTLWINTSSQNPDLEKTIRLRIDDDNDEFPYQIALPQPGRCSITFSGPGIDEKTITNIDAPAQNVDVQLAHEQTPSIIGNVIDFQTSKPVTNFKARLRIVNSSKPVSPRHIAKWSTFQNTDGLFELPAPAEGIYQVQIAATNLAWAVTEPIDTENPEIFTVTLYPPGTIKGMVLNDKNQPLTGAAVIPLSKASGTTPQTADMFVSQEGAVETVNGYFTLTDLPEGMETVKVTHPDYPEVIVDSIPVQHGKVTGGIEITLQTGGSIEGFVYDLEGSPMAHTTLEIYQDMPDTRLNLIKTVVTDSDGFYHASGLPQTVCFIQHQSPWNKLGVLRNFAQPSQTQSANLDLGSGNAVTGTIYLNNKPLANAQIMFSDPDSASNGNFVARTLTDSGGFFEITGIHEGIYGLYCIPQGELNNWKKLIELDIPDSDTDLNEIEILTETALTAAEPNQP